MLDTQAHPPHVELGETVQRAGRERYAVIGANRRRQSELSKYALEDLPRTMGFDRGEPVAGEKKPRVLIGDRER